MSAVRRLLYSFLPFTALWVIVSNGRYTRFMSENVSCERFVWDWNGFFFRGLSRPQFHSLGKNNGQHECIVVP